MPLPKYFKSRLQPVYEKPTDHPSKYRNIHVCAVIPSLQVQKSMFEISNMSKDLLLSHRYKHKRCRGPIGIGMQFDGLHSMSTDPGTMS